MIEEITRYRFDGKEFNDLKAVGKYVENEIGKVIDSTPLRLHPRDALAVYDALVNNRHRLVKMLTAEYVVDDEIQAGSKNILDFDKPRKTRRT